MQLAAALRELVTALDDSGVEYALVGGLATSARGEARFTRDVDVAVSVEGDAQAESLVWQLQQRNFSLVATVEQDATGRLATARLSSPAGVICDLVLATCGIEPEIVQTAELLEVFPGMQISTASVEALLAMKVLSATPQRPRDMEDIRAVVLANPDFNEARVKQYLRLMRDRGYARQQALDTKWHQLRTQLGV